MSDERCPDCNAARSAGCACAPTTGFDPLRIRPYVTRPNRPAGASDWSPTGTGRTEHGSTGPAAPGPGTAAPGTPGFGATGPGLAGPHGTPDAGRSEPHPVLGVVQPPNAMTQPFPAYGTPEPPPYDPAPLPSADVHPAGAPGSRPERSPYDSPTPPPHPDAQARPAAPGEEYATQPLPVTPEATEHDPAHEPGGDTMMLRAVALPHGPQGVDPQAPGPRAAGRGQGRGRRSGREGRPVPLMAGAAVAVLAAAALVAFMVPGDEDGDRAVARTLPGRTSGANASTDADSPGASASAAAPSADPEASTSPEASATPSPSASAAPTESPSADPSTPATTPSPRPTRSKAEDPGGPTLSTGDAGAEVTELQRRLAEWGTYRGPVNGHYTSKLRSAVADFQDSAHVSGDPSGVYGPATRQVLEKVTHEP
ncbi:peptidoglycan-binding protein [Streptomyces sp. NRRL S-87]|uniref:peptidoglycan-binding protein n=1 Tax=Streptomyces sp. NRRL S-87 TaxID=1463920 RepID=UPI000689A0FA|nr:peptidoglycan-binding protein [Streptomyces sp. NRRL S-87]